MYAQAISHTKPGSILPPPLEDITLRHLATHREIEGISHLREVIDLSVHLPDPSFALLEKKEMSTALSSASSLTGGSWEPSGSCRWDTD